MVASSVQKIEQSGNQYGFALKTVMEKDYGTWLKLAYNSVQNQISRFVILSGARSTRSKDLAAPRNEILRLALA